MAVNIKYTKEQEEELLEGYPACETDDERDDFMLKFQAKHDKSSRSLIAKLSKMGIYVIKPKLSKVTNEKAETKEQMVGKITRKLGFKDGELEGLDKTPKLVLVKVLKRLEQDD